MKTLGIIGGLGPETTASFYLELISLSAQMNTSQRPPMLIWNVAMPYAIEQQVLVDGVGEEKFLPYLIEGAQNLERGGADFLVMPCNTLHVLIEGIRASVSVPVISILDTTTKALVDENITRVGFLSTAVTVKKQIYDTKFKNAGITTIIPTSAEQEVANNVIYNIVSNDVKPGDTDKLQTIVDSLITQDVEAIVLACTDLQQLVNPNQKVKVFDTMKILAQAAAREMCK
jgi:aspartate racemase